VTPSTLEESYFLLLSIINTLEKNRRYINTNPKCEPQLGTRGLYDSLGGDKNRKNLEMAMLWVLNLSDGMHSLVDVAERSEMDFNVIAQAADLLLHSGLLLSEK